MKSITHINNAIKDLDREVELILLDMRLSLTEKDNKMLPLVEQKKILTKALESLVYLQQNPPKLNQPCGISKYRDD